MPFAEESVNLAFRRAFKGQRFTETRTIVRPCPEGQGWLRPRCSGSNGHCARAHGLDLSKQRHCPVGQMPLDDPHDGHVPPGPEVERGVAPNQRGQGLVQRMFVGNSSGSRAGPISFKRSFDQGPCWGFSFDAAGGAGTRHKDAAPNRSKWAFEVSVKATSSSYFFCRTCSSSLLQWLTSKRAGTLTGLLLWYRVIRGRVVGAWAYPLEQSVPVAVAARDFAVGIIRQPMRMR